MTAGGPHAARSATVDSPRGLKLSTPEIKRAESCSFRREVLTRFSGRKTNAQFDRTARPRNEPSRSYSMLTVLATSHAA